MSRLDQLAIGDVAPVVYDVVRVANPAAGADPVIAVPGNQVWEILSLTGVLATSAVAGSRRPSVIIDDQTTTVARIAPGLTEAAAQSVRWSYIAGYALETGDTNTAVTESFPDGVALPGGWRVRFSTNALDVGDQWSQVSVWIRRIDLGVSALALARQAVEDVYSEPTAFLGP